jgi:hypothetical protein
VLRLEAHFGKVAARLTRRALGSYRAKQLSQNTDSVEGEVTMGVVESASRLFNLLASHDTTFTKYLKPGLVKNQIDSLMSPTGIALSAEAITFYSHYDLPQGYQYNSDQPTFFGIFWLLSLEDALREYELRRSSDYFRQQESGWFPLLQEDPNFYYLDTARTSGDICPIIGGSEYIEPDVVFISLEAMFDTMYAWIEEGVLEIEAGHVAGDYTGDPERVAEIAARFNPGVECWRTR